LALPNTSIADGVIGILIVFTAFRSVVHRRGFGTSTGVACIEEA
jgi:hypothetical protein